MMNRMIILLIQMLTALAINGQVSTAGAGNLSFKDFDRNDNMIIEQTEFVEAFTAYYVDDWNSIDNDYLNDENFYSFMYRDIDTDQNEKLSEPEWQMAYNKYFKDYVLLNYDDIDVDVDGYILYNEYNIVMTGTQLFNDWDFDNNGVINQIEMGRGMFNRWDKDNSGFIDLEEYHEFDETFSDI